MLRQSLMNVTLHLLTDMQRSVMHHSLRRLFGFLGEPPRRTPWRFLTANHLNVRITRAAMEWRAIL